MKKDRPKWPDSLPPPIEIVEAGKNHYFCENDFVQDSYIASVIHDLYWFTEDKYYLYFEYGKGIDPALLRLLEQNGVAMNKTEMYFYRHPKPKYKNDFIRVLPHSEVAKWQQEAAKDEMYGRCELTLESAHRKQLDIAESARQTAEIIADKEPVIEAKPNFFGFGINLNSSWHRFKRWIKRKTV